LGGGPKNLDAKGFLDTGDGSNRKVKKKRKKKNLKGVVVETNDQKRPQKTDTCKYTP